MITSLFRLLILLCLMLSCVGASAQNSASSRYKEGNRLHAESDFAGAQVEFERSRALALEESEFVPYFEASGMLLDCLHKNSEIRKLAVEIDAMRADLLRYQDNISNRNYHRFGHVNRMFSSLAYVELGDSDGALKVLIPMLDSLDALPTSADSMANYVRKFKALLYISEIYLAQGNFEQTLFYTNEAIILSTSLPNTDGWLLVPHYTRISNYILTGRTKEASEELRNIVELLPDLEERRIERTIVAYLKISELHLKNRSLDSALHYLNLLKDLDNVGSKRLEASFLEGEIYFAMEEYEKSKQVYLNINHQLMDIGAEDGERSGMCHLELGKIALKQDRPSDALGLLHTALSNFSEHYGNSDPLSIPTLEMLYSRLTPVEVLYFKSKALFNLYQSLGDSKYLVASWNTVNLGIDFVDKLRKSYYGVEDKAFLIEQSYRIFEHALRICHHQLSSPNQVSWVDTAFTLMERSKALNLMDAVMHENARQFAGIPESLLSTEAGLRVEISKQEESIRKLKASKSYDESVLRRNTSVLGEKQKQYRALLKTMETDHPRYYQLRHGASEICLNDIQVLLEKNETVVEYFTGESEIYTLIIEKGRKQLIANHNAKEVESLVLGYRSSIQAYIDGEGSSSNDSLYLTTAHALYDSLVAPVLPLQKSIIVVLDGVLNYLSFAGLLSDNPTQYYDFRDQPYMVWEHEMSYCYSMSLYRELKQKQQADADRVVVFAPEFNANSTLGQLTFNEEEAQRVAEQTKGETLVGKTCTASAVRAQLQNDSGYRIVHFATHGVADIANGTDSYLQFAGPADSNRLYARELYNYSLDADLVYLSACETGGGQLRRGEGIISIARAFFYAGSRSLVTALWSISDARAKDLTIGFYDALMAGETIDGSVAIAQRQYLKHISAEERYLAHPAYWSALVPIGSSAAIVPANNILWCVLLVGLLTIFFMLPRFLIKSPSKG